MRYEPIELDGKWYVMDHSHPESAPAERIDELDAKFSANFWNSLTTGTYQAWVNDRS